MPKGARVLRGAVYKVEHADGSIEYTNVRPRGRRARGASTRTLFTYIATCVACNVHSGIDWAHVPLRLDAYAPTIRAASAKYGVDPALVRAVIHAESAFNPRAVSAKGAQGLMQLMPSTASDMGVNNAFDARQNIRGGARYLARLLKTFHGDARLAAAAYNAGPDAVQKYGGVPPYAETRVYVRRVALLHHRYRQAMQPRPRSPAAARADADWGSGLTAGAMLRRRPARSAADAGPASRVVLNGLPARSPEIATRVPGLRSAISRWRSDDGPAMSLPPMLQQHVALLDAGQRPPGCPDRRRSPTRRAPPPAGRCWHWSARWCTRCPASRAPRGRAR